MLELRGLATKLGWFDILVVVVVVVIVFALLSWRGRGRL